MTRDRLHGLRRIVVVAVAVASGACGELAEASRADQTSDGAANGAAEASTLPLDCAWLAAPNCWSRAVASVAACLGSSVTDLGTFSADRLACTYADGETTAFDVPPPIYSPEAGLVDPLGFTVKKDGVVCAEVTQTGGTSAAFVLSLTFPGGTLSSSVSADQSTLSITCPDGQTYAATGAGPQGWGAALGSCLSGGPAIDYAVGASGGFTADLGGAGLTTSLLLVSCAP